MILCEFFIKIKLAELIKLNFQQPAVVSHILMRIYNWN